MAHQPPVVASQNVAGFPRAVSKKVVHLPSAVVAGPPLSRELEEARAASQGLVTVRLAPALDAEEIDAMPLETTEKSALWYLARQADAQRIARVTTLDLAAACGCSERTMRRVLATLRRAEYIRQRTRHQARLPGESGVEYLILRPRRRSDAAKLTGTFRPNT